MWRSVYWSELSRSNIVFTNLALNPQGWVVQLNSVFTILALKSIVVWHGRVMFWIGDPNDDQIWPMEAACCYVCITYMNNKLQVTRTNQNATIKVQIRINQSRTTCLVWLLPGVDLLRLDPRLRVLLLINHFPVKCCHLLSGADPGSGERGAPGASLEIHRQFQRLFPILKMSRSISTIFCK
jgi:hypothetical protein